MISSQETRSRWGAVLTGVATAVAVVILLRPLLPIPARLVVAILFAAGAAILNLRQRKAQLRVSRIQFSLRGGAAFTDLLPRSVPCSDIKWLEYRKDASGVETGEVPGGLYAVAKRHAVCVLPFVNAEETGLAIASISAKFPDLSQQWSRTDAFANRLTTLDMNK